MELIELFINRIALICIVIVASNAVKAMPPSERVNESSTSIAFPSTTTINELVPPALDPSDTETYLDYYGNASGPHKYPTSNQAAELIDRHY